MPLPDQLRIRLDDPDFWRAYFFDVGARDAHDEDEEAEVEIVPLGAVFPVGGGYALVLDFDTRCGIIRLGMRTQDSASTLELGWDDQSHWHPDALRWTELDLIARAAAVLDPALRHPGPVLALAARFVVLDHGDDLDAVTPLMDAAFGTPPSPRDDGPDDADPAHRLRPAGAGRGVVAPHPGLAAPGRRAAQRRGMAPGRRRDLDGRSGRTGRRGPLPVQPAPPGWRVSVRRVAGPAERGRSHAGDR
ncbi:hypothetical protein [Dactylosporangium cerinum]